MTDSRRVDELRTHAVQIKLTEREFTALRRLARLNFRTAGEQLRALLADACAKHKETDDATHLSNLD